MTAFCFTDAMKKGLLIVLASIFAWTTSIAQEITTASIFFAGMSEKYGAIKDYSADLVITSGTDSRKKTMNTTVSFQHPDKLRIDFTKPANQVILFTGQTLTIYLPAYRTVLNQSLDKDNTGLNATFATPQGLSLLKRSYTIAYETSADPQPLDGSSTENAVTLILHRRAASETFRSIRLLVSPESKLIRRIEAWPISGNKITFDFYNYRLNTGIPDSRFLYELPPAADMINNFLFEN